MNKTGEAKNEQKPKSEKTRELTGSAFRAVAQLVLAQDSGMTRLPMKRATSADGVTEWVHEDNVQWWEECNALTPWHRSRWKHPEGSPARARSQKESEKSEKSQTDL